MGLGLSLSLGIDLGLSRICYVNIHVYIISDRKNCEGLTEKPLDLSYNGSSFIWNPEIGAKVCLSLSISLYLSLSLSLCPYVSICLSICLSVYMSFWLYVSIGLSVYMSVSDCLSIHVCLYVFVPIVSVYITHSQYTFLSHLLDCSSYKLSQYRVFKSERC